MTDTHISSIITDEIYESLMDRYPFQSKEEIDIVWNLYHHHGHDSLMGTSSSSLSSCTDIDSFSECIMGMVGRRGPIHDLRQLYESCSSSDRQTAQELLLVCHRFAMDISTILLSNPSTNKNEDPKLHETNIISCKGMISSLKKFHQEHIISNTNNQEEEDVVIPFSIFQEWVESKFPNIMKLSSTYYHLQIFGKDIPYCKGNRTMFEFPQLLSSATVNGDDNDDDEEYEICQSHFFQHYSLFSILCMESQLSNKWLRLYTNEVDGCSFVSLHRCIAGYNGPTLLLIRPKIKGYSDDNNDDGSFFGFFTSHGWKESQKEYYGSSDCFLFHLSNQLANIYRPKCLENNNQQQQQQNEEQFVAPWKQKIPNENYMFLSPSTISTATRYSNKRTKLGLTIGGTLEIPRLFISETLEGCIASYGGEYQDETFVKGPLLHDNHCTMEYFDIDVLEVWGIGGSSSSFQDALQSRQELMEQIDTQRKHVQQIKDKRVFLSDFQSGVYDNNKLYSHRTATRGRHEFEVSHPRKDSRYTAKKEEYTYDDHSDEDDPNRVHFTCLR